MDKTSKKIIKYLKSQPGNQLFYYDAPHSFLDIDEDEFFRCIRYLEKNDLVEFISNQHGQHLGVQLTHNAIHVKEINRSIRIASFKQWFFHSYLGGIITGVTATLLTQFFSAHGSRLVEKLYLLLSNH